MDEPREYHFMYVHISLAKSIITVCSDLQSTPEPLESSPNFLPELPSGERHSN
jgi:hypothetical protein